MDLAITPIKLILQAARKIHQIAHDVKANHKQCHILNERVQIIAELVKKLQESGQDLSTVNACITQTKDCLNSCIIFIVGFSGENPWYRKILAHNSNKEKFKELNDDLQKCIAGFTLGMVVDAKIGANAKLAFNRELDVAAEEQDRKQIAVMQDVILQAHHEAQTRLQEIMAAQNAEKRAALAQQQAQKLQAEIMQQQLESLRAQLHKMASPPQTPVRLPLEKSLIIPLAELEILDVIGDGSKATVYKGKFYSQDVAVKKLKQLTPEGRLELFREATLLARLKSPQIIKVIGACIEEGKECLVMELMQGGSLQEYLTHSATALAPNIVKQLALEIAIGIQSLHRQHAIHRDLKPANILLTQDLHPKIGDFDLAVMDTSSLKDVTYAGCAYEYMAPELLQLKPQATNASDVYSYGGILYALLTRHNPPRVKSPALLANVPEPYKTIIAKCWQDTPSDRESIDAILKVVTEYEPPAPPDMRALYQIGAEHEKAGRMSAAQQCYLNSAALGYGRSEFRVGMFFLQGKAPDKTQAFAYFNKAATHESRDQAKACFNLGVMLETGDGVAANPHQSYRWYTEAARLGNDAARARADAIKRSMEAALEDNADSLGAVTQVATAKFKPK